MPQYIVLRYYSDGCTAPRLTFPAKEEGMLDCILAPGGDCIVIYKIYQEYEEISIGQIYTNEKEI